MGTPWIAAGNSFNGKPQTFYWAIFSQSFNAILRAGGGVPALAAKPRRNDQLVKPDQCNEREA